MVNGARRLSEMVAEAVRRSGQDGALANARAAATELARRRVEREEVEIYLEHRRDRVHRSA